jgi:hypothetical protein
MLFLSYYDSKARAKTKQRKNSHLAISPMGHSVPARHIAPKCGISDCIFKIQKDSSEIEMYES